jgi:Na+/proline symporter
MAMLLPAGLKGIIIASMLAAFMSTYSSLLSWSSTYAVNDLYRRFLVKNASSMHYVRASQLIMLPLAIASGLITYYAQSILNLLFYVFLATTGYYTVQLLRWLWWRVNAWAEVAGLLGSLFFTLLICFVFPDWVKPEYMEQYYGHRMIFVTCATFIVCLIVIFATKSTPDEILDNFYRKVRPPGLWGPIRQRLGMKSEYTVRVIVGHFLSMLLAIYGTLVGLIKLIFGEMLLGLILLFIGIFALVIAVIRVHKFYGEDSVVNENCDTSTPEQT